MGFCKLQTLETDQINVQKLVNLNIWNWLGADSHPFKNMLLTELKLLSLFHLPINEFFQNANHSFVRFRRPIN